EFVLPIQPCDKILCVERSERYFILAISPQSKTGGAYGLETVQLRITPDLNFFKRTVADVSHEFSVSIHRRGCIPILVLLFGILGLVQVDVQRAAMLFDVDPLGVNSFVDEPDAFLVTAGENEVNVR